MDIASQVKGFVSNIKIEVIYYRTGSNDPESQVVVHSWLSRIDSSGINDYFDGISEASISRLVLNVKRMVSNSRMISR